MKPAAPLLRETRFSTGFGPVRLFWDPSGPGLKVHRILLPGDCRDGPVCSPAVPDTFTGENEPLRSLVRDIRRFLSGSAIAFSTGLLSLDECPPFQQRVLLAEHAIPPGFVSTYGRIARHLGNPGAARAVGNALARNPFPLLIPCHRALRSDGDPGGFQGGRRMKVRLLAPEGCRAGPDGRIRMDRVWY